jgi:hypothetical protein
MAHSNPPLRTPLTYSLTALVALPAAVDLVGDYRLPGSSDRLFPSSREVQVWDLPALNNLAAWLCRVSTARARRFCCGTSWSLGRNSPVERAAVDNQYAATSFRPENDAEFSMLWHTRVRRRRAEHTRVRLRCAGKRARHVCAEHRYDCKQDGIRDAELLTIHRF